MITTGASKVLGDVAADLIAALTDVINTTKLQLDLPVSMTALGNPAVDGRVLVTGMLGADPD